MKRYAIRVRGRVQGVFFRDSAQRRAEELRISGWVRNAGDGSVEIEAEGEETALEEFITWCHRGPPAARVETIDVREVPVARSETFGVLG